jgi:hypothetical protein
MIGIGLAIYFQISWVAITVVSLWAAAAALSYMGRALINHALTLPVQPVQASMADDNTVDSIMPSAPKQASRPDCDTKDLITYSARTKEKSNEKSVEMTPISSNKDALYYQHTVARWAGYDNPHKSNGNRHPTVRSCY